MDPLIRDKICSFIPEDRLARLKQVNSRGGSFHKRTERTMTKLERNRLLNGKFFRSYDVVAVTDEIGLQLKSMKVQRQETFDGLDDKETLKEAIMNESRARLHELLLQKEKQMDIKRELEFEILMLEEQIEKVDAREQKRLDNMQHKIDLVKMKQEKIQSESKSEN